MEVIYEPVMMGWGYFWYFVLSLVISYATRPDPPKGPADATATGIEGFDVPTAQDGKPIPVLFGRQHIRSPNVIWYGDIKTEAIRQSTGGGKK